MERYFKVIFMTVQQKPVSIYLLLVNTGYSQVAKFGLLSYSLQLKQ